MRTLKRYFNLTDASLVKTMLEDYEVFCSLFDEHSHTIGLYFAVPVRLMVADSQLSRAAHILAYAEASPIPGDDVAPADNNVEVSVLDEQIFGEDAQSDELAGRIQGNNPWEILAIAYLFLIPGSGFLLEHLPLMLYIGGRRGNRYLILSPFDLHAVGAGLVCVALLLTISYFYARRAITRPTDI